MTDPPPVCVSHDVLQGPLAARHERPEHSPDARLGGLQEEEDQQTNSHTFVSTLQINPTLAQSKLWVK